MILIGKSYQWLMAGCIVLLLIQGVCAFSVEKASVTPSVIYPGTTVNVSYTVFAASGVSFPSYDDIQFVTELDDPSWTYTIMVNGVKNTRPVVGGKMLTINGFELSYEDKDEVVVQATLKATIPAGTALGANKTLVRIQELDARGYSIGYSAVNIEHLIGQPTPTPTPAYGSIVITSAPPGADIYIDNVYKGLSPAVFGSVPNGNHVVLIRLDGYQDFTQSVTIVADTRAIDADLVPKGSSPVITSSPGQTGTPATTLPAQASGYGSLSITTTPPGALVYVDGTMKGVTPATIPMLAEGPHSVTLMMDGYQDLKTTITINDGTTSEYITGLVKTQQTPGFAAALALLSVAFLILYRKNGT